jgi:multimeric flavodoxin WrbA
MRILGINGSHRKGQSSYVLLKYVLNELEKAGCSIKLVELIDYNIKYCSACNKCLKVSECSIKDDDFKIIVEDVLLADCIIFSTPVYFSNVTSLLKVFIDRTRSLHMKKDLLKDKLGASIVIGGLQFGGQEIVAQIIDNYMLNMGMRVVKPRLIDSPIYSINMVSTLYDGLDNDKIRYKRKEDLIDSFFKKTSELLVKNIVSNCT